MTPARRHPAAYPNYVLAAMSGMLGAERRELARPLRILDPTDARNYYGEHGAPEEASSQLQDLWKGMSEDSQRPVQPCVQDGECSSDQRERRDVQDRPGGPQLASGRVRTDPSAQEGDASSVGQNSGAEHVETAGDSGLGERERPSAQGNDYPPRGPGHAERRPRQFIADLTGWSSPGAPARVREEAHRSRQTHGSEQTPLWVCDGFSGIGRIHDLPQRICQTVGVELEPSWAATRQRTLQGDATALPSEWTGLFDCYVTSPCYGNRMSDSYEAKDSCFQCKGIGTAWSTLGCADAPFLCPDCSDVACKCGGMAKAMKAHNRACPPCAATICKACKGDGLSRRYTYRAALGRPLQPNNAGQLQWGPAYRDLHEKAWAEAYRVLRPGGLILVNIKNHIRDGAEQFVVEWHKMALEEVGFRVKLIEAVKSPGIRHGQNWSARVDHEQIIAARS